jgi:hypothetical protein
MSEHALPHNHEFYNSYLRKICETTSNGWPDELHRVDEVVAICALLWLDVLDADDPASLDLSGLLAETEAEKAHAGTPGFEIFLQSRCWVETLGDRRDESSTDPLTIAGT